MIKRRRDKKAEESRAKKDENQVVSKNKRRESKLSENSNLDYE